MNKVKSILNEFKSFAVKGNVIDLAVGIIIGGAFGKIVSSIVSDIIMPPIGLILGGVDFADKVIILKAATAEAPAILLKYGLFINSVINFIIVAAAIFFLIKQVNKLKKEAPAPESNLKECPFCFMQISKKATRCPNCTSTLN